MQLGCIRAAITWQGDRDFDVAVGEVGGDGIATSGAVRAGAAGDSGLAGDVRAGRQLRDGALPIQLTVGREMITVHNALTSAPRRATRVVVHTAAVAPTSLPSWRTSSVQAE